MAFVERRKQPRGELPPGAEERRRAPVADGAGSGWRDYPSQQDEGAHTVVGTVKVLERVHSPQLENERDLYVYLPPSYGRSDRRYPVLYMHDGQNLFDQATSFSEEWEV